MSFHAYPPRLHIDFSELVSHSSRVVFDVIFKMHKQNFGKVLLGNLPAIRPQRDQRGTALFYLKQGQGKISRYRRDFEFKHRANHQSFEVSPKFELQVRGELLKHFEKLNRKLIEQRLIPLTRVSALLRCLALNPITSVRQLAESAQVSEITARRWLAKLTKAGVTKIEFFGGQNQFINLEYLAIVEKLVTQGLLQESVIASATNRNSGF